MIGSGDNVGDGGAVSSGGVFRANGPVSTVSREEFINVLAKTYKADVYATKKGIFRARYLYAVEWEGKTYFTETRKQFQFTEYIRVVNVKKIAI
ncbi:MAG: hypothetical protein QGH39_04370 [Candidatus Thermoplasmatota archaeon]|jgi:hypothetical protein|nr:hypothetical protein [Candidatus Thermoplasmatota archaeon]